MKLALLCDQHYGIRNAHPRFLETNRLFLQNTFFPYIDEHNITTVVNLGDLVDNRRSINIGVAQCLRTDFVEPIIKRHIDYYHILGNHDIHLRNSSHPNSIEELYGDVFSKIYAKAEEIDFDGTKILFVPWMHDGNGDEILKAIDGSTAQICFGHLELCGFETYKGIVAPHGLPSDVFRKFDITCSGHYHHKSSVGNIHYLGSCNQYNWSDHGDPRGFHVFDTETRDLLFVHNPIQVFKKFFYSDEKASTIQELITPDLEEAKGSFVKVVVRQKNNTWLFDNYIALLEKYSPVDIQVVEDHLNFYETPDNAIISEAEDTVTVFRKCIDQLTGDVDRARLFAIMDELYKESLAL